MRRLFTLVLSTVLLVVPATGMAFAFSVDIVNSSFETPTLNNGGVNTNVNGWTLSGFGGVMNPTDAQLNEAVPNGNNVAFLNNNGSTLSQSLLEVVQSNTTYIMSLDVGLNAFEFGTPGFTARLLSGSTLLGSATYNASLLNWGNFTPMVITYTTGTVSVPSNLVIELTSIGTSQILIDDVRLSASNLAAVPLPTSIMLLGMGALGLVATRARKH